MEKIGIVTEEVADLPQKIITEHQIAIVPVKLDWPDLEKMPGENTFQKMRELEKRGIKSFGKTSQASPNDYLEKYRKQLELFDKIICITISSKHSGSYNSALLAKQFAKPEEQKRIFIVDSLNGTAGQSLLILKTIDLIHEKKEVKAIIKEVEEFKSKIRLFLMLEDPKWLEASGRISSLIGNILRRLAKAGIRPVLSIKNGKIAPARIKIKAKDIPSTIFQTFKKDTELFRREGKKIRVVITHGDDVEGSQRLKDAIEKELKNIEISFVNTINNVIGAPTGPNTLALAWCEI